MAASDDPAADPVTARNRAKRLHARARYDHATVHAPLGAGTLCPKVGHRPIGSAHAPHLAAQGRHRP